MTVGHNNQEPEAGARDRLLAAALAVFNEKGYAAASVREIVESAGVTKPVLYYYFGNKEGLYLELMKNSYRSFESLVADFASVEGSAWEKIIRLCSDLFETSRERLPEVRLIHAIHYGPPQGAPHFDLEAYLVELMELIERLVSEGMSKGELARHNAEDVARAIIAILTSAINDQLSKREPRLELEGMLTMLRLLLRGIAQG